MISTVIEIEGNPITNFSYCRKIEDNIYKLYPPTYSASISSKILEDYILFLKTIEKIKNIYTVFPKDYYQRAHQENLQNKLLIKAKSLEFVFQKDSEDESLVIYKTLFIKKIPEKKIIKNVFYISIINDAFNKDEILSPEYDFSRMKEILDIKSSILKLFEDII